MNREDLIKTLGELGFPLVVTDKKAITQKMLMEVLESLVSSGDSRLIEGFPVIMATAGHRGTKLDIQRLVSKYTLKSRKRRNLEKLLLMSYELLNKENLEAPEGLRSWAASLEKKYGDLFLDETLALDKGMSVSISRMRNTLRRYTASLSDSRSAKEKERLRQQQSFKLHMHMSTLFSPKQKELVLKKLEGETFTKTELEYYSRVVKKKLEALTNSELRKIAIKLTKK